jgi:chromosome segregation ATPase
MRGLIVLRILRSAGLIAGLLALACSSTYYAAWEALGKEKRDLLRDDVQKVKRDQEKAATTFENALDQLRAMYDVDADDLEREYDKLKNEAEDANDRAEAVRDRIDSVNKIASDLFTEWESEIDEISSPNLRSKSRKKLTTTRQRYGELERTLRRSEAKMDPVLTQLNDQVLYLKHNLNAAAVGGLSAEVGAIEADIEDLIQDMRESIAEAEQFLAGLPD